MKTERFRRLYIALKFRLLGMNYYRALQALELGANIHDGYRKDGITPEYEHQLDIALHILTLKSVDGILEDLIILALLHDVKEDYPKHIVSIGERSRSIQAYILDTFGQQIDSKLDLLDKNRSEKELYHAAISQDLQSALVKLADRCNNFQSMSRGNFSLEKQRGYADEVEHKFLPMAKSARKLFPQYTDAFYSLERMLKSQLEFVRMYVEAASKVPQ